MSDVSPDRWVVISLLSLLVWLPVPLGSKFPPSFTFMAFTAFALLLAWLVWHRHHRSPLEDCSQPEKLILLLLAASLLYQVIQCVPLPLALAGVLSPTAMDVYAFTNLDTEKRFFSLSLDVGLSLQELLKSLAYATLFLLTMLLVDSRKRLNLFVLVLICAGSAQAIFGLLDAAVGGTLFRQPFIGWEGRAWATTGTYVKYNHYAGLLEMSIALALGLLLANRQKAHDSGDWRRRLIAVSQFLLSTRPLPYLALLVMITALFSSTSRGGNLSLIAACGLSAVVMLGWRTVQQRDGRLVMLVVSIVGVAGVLGFGELYERLDRIGLDTDRRYHREMAYRVISDYPLTGTGSGTWVQVYPAYQYEEPYSEKLVSHVHNDYLELLVEQGVAGFALFGMAILVAVGHMTRALRRRRDPYLRGVLFGCLTATLSLLIHSFGDFNLRIPANAAWFSVILALGLVAARLPHDA